MNEKAILIWMRKSPHSSNNFDLILSNPETVDVEVLTQALDRIVEVRHRGLTLNSTAVQAFRDWLATPSDPLKSLAYVSLSNWFLTNGGDKHSEVASRCERFWDELFRCRPMSRLSSSVRAQNQKMLPEEFGRFWPRLLAAQNGDSSRSELSEIPSGVLSGTPLGEGTANRSSNGHLRAVITTNKMRCEVEGSPQAIAQLMHLVSAWEQRPTHEIPS